MSDIRIYHISPLRRWFIWYVLGPMLVALVIGGIAFDSAEAKALLATAGLVFLIGLPFQWMVDRTRLELSHQGVCLRQIGYTLETVWSNVIEMRLRPGSEGFITNTPLAGAGAERLAAFRGVGMRGGTTLYDAGQQALLAERRLIPIEAFGWYLRRGSLRADIVRFAPHLKELLDTLDAPRES